MNGQINALRNWGSWARDRYHKQHCASLENRYRSPQAWGDWENAVPDSIAPPVDILAAVAAQKVIRKLGFQFAWALTFQYCYPAYDRWKAARVCKVYRPERLLRLITKAEHAFINAHQSFAPSEYKDSVERTSVISVAHREQSASRQGRVFLKAA